MSNAVVKLSGSKLAELRKFYGTNEVPAKAASVQFSAKLADTTITAYTSGKVLFQGAGAGREAAKWGTVEEKAKTASSSAKGDTLPADFAKKSVIGSDETGTGDFFGPITVAACYVPADKVELAMELGVKDSKQLTDDYMRKIAPDLKASFIHSTLTLPNDKYNDVQAKGWSQGKMKALMHNKAIRHVLRKLDGEKPDAILIDQFAERGVYYRHLKDQAEIVRDGVLFSTKAEGLHVSVACASIFARVAFLDAMDELSRKAGVLLPKGAGQGVDEAAARILLKKGPEFLQTISKVHFANTKKAEVLAKKKIKG
ncbi:ribonuclease HIII [Planococcus lenghuensis]|uniref:Ribonuclease HIII n=1 Tax=Planococcus lenghuensis TaxID=2213202 RepID=A0A1Q2KXC1_9BACL|nr:ribonuclease HIII [Planococcus lenghuensis]AQQ52840.1 ribonuclease HIII [Planococcus lenghuensis]